LQDVCDLGRVGVALEEHPADSEGKLGGADGCDAEHGQLRGAPLVVGERLQRRRF
jgi:hypothetical protein